MKRTFVKTWALLGVAAAFGAYLYFVESKRPAGDEKKKEKLFSFEKDKVKGLSLAAKGQPELRLVRDAGAWRMEQPALAPADASAADSLVTSLEGLEIEEVVTETPAGLGDFGLESPKARLSVSVEGVAAPFAVLVGDKAPDGSGLYAKLPDKPRVFTIASWLDSSFDKKPFDFRDRDLLHVKRDAIRTLEVNGPEGSYALVKGAKEEWSFTQPVLSRAGRWSVDSLLGTIEGLRMEEIKADDATDLKPFGLDKPQRRIVLSLADGTQKVLEIGAAAGEKKWHARDAASRMVAVIPGALVDDLAKGMGELRAKRLLDISTYDVSGFDVESAGKKSVYTRTTRKNDNGIDVHDWKRTAPSPKALDSGKIQDALFKVTGVEALAFVDAPKPLGSYGLDAPALRLTLRFEGDKPPAWVEVAKKDAAAYARRVDDAAILEIEPQKADELLQALGGL